MPNRLNCIISKSRCEESISSKNYNIYPNLDNCLQSLQDTQFDKINKLFVIGGEQLYKEAIVYPRCDKLYINIIPTTYECDTFFSKIDLSIYNQCSFKEDDKKIQYMIK